MASPGGIWNHCLEHAALSDIGLRRANNQDAFAVALAGDQADYNERGHLFLVADGMGAHAAGELASRIAADVVSLTYRKLLDQSPPEALLSAISEANRQIHTRGQVSPDFRGMGTTVTALVLLPVGALIAHVGDSRAYRLRGERLEQLTFDHSLVWEMRASGRLLNAAEAEMQGVISKNIITRSLGPNPSVQIDLEGPHPVQPGDVFLLCSDGLSNQLRDDEIGLVLKSLPPEEAVRALVDLACLRGGSDNITAIVVRVLGPQILQATEAVSSHTHSSNHVGQVHPLVWTLLGVSALGTIVMLYLGYLAIALVNLLFAAVFAAVAIWQRYSGSRRSPKWDGRRFGRGPYAASVCTPTRDLLGRLADIVRQLRDAAMSENWVVDWREFNALLTQAAAAEGRGNLAAAATAQLRAVTSLMAQLRRQKTSDSSDSGILIP